MRGVAASAFAGGTGVRRAVLCQAGTKVCTTCKTVSQDGLLPAKRSRASPHRTFTSALTGRHHRRTSYSPVIRQAAETERVGEDAAVFDVNEQSGRSWIYFFVILGVVMAILLAVWVAPGVGLADDFVEVLEGFSSDSSVQMALILMFFALVHSGLAFLRPYGLIRNAGVITQPGENVVNNILGMGEQYPLAPTCRPVPAGLSAGEAAVGARAYRVVFASVSLPLATVALFFFINHRYDGMPLWNLRGVPGIHDAVWWLNFVSFFFLYPSTFNLLEVAAVDKPKLHMWETGVMRITRHPQAFGQLLWCVGHTLWIGNSFMVVTSLGLLAHHVFGCLHGDFRLQRQYGDAFEAVKARTSIVPFAAILDGRQQLPPDYYKEWLRVPYAAIIVFTLGAYWAHPLMQRAAYWLNW